MLVTQTVQIGPVQNQNSSTGQVSGGSSSFSNVSSNSKIGSEPSTKAQTMGGSDTSQTLAGIMPT